MRIIAPMMILIMMTSTLAGCTGGDSDGGEIDDNPIVGDWYMAESLVLEINQDGTLATPDENGSWSTEGDYLQFYFEDGGPIFRFIIEGGLLWLTNSGVDGCIVFAPEMINEDEFEDRKIEIDEEGNLEGFCG